ncbi:MAG: EI24 domain-containing protein [Elainellaceae cyanobacterium]
MADNPSPQLGPGNSAPKPVRRGPGSIFAGATYPVRALRLFATQPRLRRYVIFPILLNIVVGATLYAGLLFLGLRLIDSIMLQAAAWTGDLQAIAPKVGQLAPDVHIFDRAPNWVLAWEAWLGNLLSGLVGWFHWPSWLSAKGLNFDWLTFDGPKLPSLTLPSGIAGLWQRVLAWLAAVADRLGQSLTWLQVIPRFLGGALLWLLRVVLTLLLLIVTGFILLQFGVLLGAPWYGKLSEELETLRTGQAVVIDVGLVRDIWRAILFEIKKLAIALGFGAPLLLLGLVPGFGPLLTSFGSVAVGGTLTCLDFFDAPLERRRLSFRRKLAVVGQSLPASATFALVCLTLVSVPFINLLAIPVCVTAGTLFVCDRVLPSLR